MHRITYEHEFLNELDKLIAKIGTNEIYFHYESLPADVIASGFRTQVQDRQILISLQLEAPQDEANSVFLFSLPPEDTCQYHEFEDENGDLCLTIAFPYCTHRPLNETPISVLRLSTKYALLDHEHSAPVVQ